MADTPLPKRDYNAPPPPSDRPNPATGRMRDENEIEGIKRMLYNVIEKLERIERRKLTTT